MDKTNERYDAIVKRIFGPTAAYGGSMGTPTQAGDARILLDGRLIGTGGTFEEALRNAQAGAVRIEHETEIKA